MSSSEKWHVVNIGNHVDLRLQKYAITQSSNSTLLIITISPNRADVSFRSFSQKHHACSDERSRVFQTTKIKRVHNSHKPLESRTLIYWHIKNCFFSLCILLSVEDNSSSLIRESTAKCRPQSRSRSAKLGEPMPGAEGAVTTINLFTLSLLSKELWLSVIKALNTLKLFSHRSQDLLSRPGFNSFRGNDRMSRRSSIHSLGRSVQFFIRPLLGRFLQYVTSLTEPHNVQQLYHMLEEVSPAFAE